MGKGANEPLKPAQVDAAIDEETLQALSEQTGMSREELLERLAVSIPEAVDELSPEGELPESGQVASSETGLLDPAPPYSPKMSGGSAPSTGLSRSAVADRNPDGPRQDGMTPRPSDEPLI